MSAEEKILSVVKPTIERMVKDLTNEQPKDIAIYMLRWLEKEKDYSSNGLSKEEKQELEKLRVEVRKYREMEKHELIKKKKEEDEKSGSDSESNDSKSEDEDDVDDTIVVPKVKMVKGRCSVSAEVYGKYNEKGAFKARFIAKTPEQILRIKARIIHSFLFGNLEKNDLDTVINAMEEKKFKAGDIVIKEGEDGDCLYFIEEGKLDCSKKIKGVVKHLKEYEAGESFGELALLYNSPRAATIVAKSDVITWVLDRETFNHIVKDAAQKKREKYEEFLKQVDILSTIDPYELMQISDALKIATFHKDEYIIKEGELGDVFYILEEGTCSATKIKEPGKPEVEIMKYTRGQYFGERALIKGEPRYASIIATSDTVRVISLDRQGFKRLLGPIEPILKRNMEKYKTFVLN